MKKKKVRRKSFILRIFALAICGYCAFNLMNLWNGLKEANAEYAELSAQYEEKKNEVEELRAILNSDSDTPLVEKAARERLGFIYSDEQVFIDISGN